jgi:hypothetical protein
LRSSNQSSPKSRRSVTVASISPVGISTSSAFPNPVGGAAGQAGTDAALRDSAEIALSADDAAGGDRQNGEHDERAVCSDPAVLS